MERYVSDMAGDALVLRFDKIVGDDPSEHHLFSEWQQWITGKRPITCIQGQVISPTWVKDAAQAIVLSCAMGLSGLYNVANQEFIARDQLAGQFTAALGINHQIVSKPQSELNLLDRRPLKSHLDSTRFLQETGMAFTPMREVISAFIRRLRPVSIK